MATETGRRRGSPVVIETETKPSALAPAIAAERRVRGGPAEDLPGALVPSAEPIAPEGARLVRMLVHRGTADEGGAFAEYLVPVEEGMVVLDALHWIQANVSPDLAVRWNCKAAKCGSCSAEVNGRPSLTCKTRLSAFAEDETITVEPMRTFPLVKDLVTDVSWNYEVNRTIQPFTPPADAPESAWRWQQRDIDRGQEFRKCIECFLCQDVCHVLRNHEIETPFMGPRYLVRVAALEMHPFDRGDRLEHLRGEGGIGYCNITKCCTEVCPEHIKITDNAIIPLKERVVDRYFDPLQNLWRWIRKSTVDPAVDVAGADAPPSTPRTGTSTTVRADGEGAA